MKTTCRREKETEKGQREKEKETESEGGGARKADLQLEQINQAAEK